MIDLLDPELHATGRAAAVFAELRARDPVSRRAGYVAVVRHADVLAVATDWATFSSARGTGLVEVAADPPLRSIHLSDPPITDTLRAVVAQSFGPPRALLAPIREAALARVAAWPIGEPIDAVATLADPLPWDLLCRLLGDDLRPLLPTVHRYARHDDARYRRAGETAIACFRDAERVVWDAVGELVADRRARPRDDAPSRLIASGALAEADLRYAIRFLIQTTYQTTALAIAAAVAICAAHPDQLATLPGDATPRAVDEVLRIASPVLRFARTATRDTELAGHPIRAGERVVMFYPSANRDAAVFAEPDRVDLQRAPNPHVAFGGGVHVCLGAYLARAQLAAVIDALRTRRIALVEPPRAIRSSVNQGFDRVVVQ